MKNSPTEYILVPFVFISNLAVFIFIVSFGWLTALFFIWFFKFDSSHLFFFFVFCYLIFFTGTWIQPAAAPAAKSLQSCPTLCDPIDSSPPGYPVPEILRQEHWSGLPFLSPVHESEKWKWSHSVVSDASDPMDCSLPGFSIHGIFQAKVLEWGAIAFSDFSAIGVYISEDYKSDDKH